MNMIWFEFEIYCIIKQAKKREPVKQRKKIFHQDKFRGVVYTI